MRLYTFDVFFERKNKDNGRCKAGQLNDWLFSIDDYDGLLRALQQSVFFFWMIDRNLNCEQLNA